jgi:Uma2 family endonuclease
MNSTPDLIEALYRIDGKAEIVDGRIVHMPHAGAAPGYASGEIMVSLRDHARRTGRGRWCGDNRAFLVDLPNRKSFCPCAAYFESINRGMQFTEGAPWFAAEIRNEEDYGEGIEPSRAAKRRDYFAAGTLVVWDVDLLSDDVVNVYRANMPDTPTVYRRGELAEAEPAVPGWTMPVDNMFA